MPVSVTLTSMKIARRTRAAIRRAGELVLIRATSSKLLAFFLFQWARLEPSEFSKNSGFQRNQFLCYAIANAQDSTAQLRQDLWVLYMLNELHGGYFVEVGACHPKKLSNTYLLEKSFAWTGLLIEPNPYLTEELRRERTSKILPIGVGADSMVNLVMAADPEFSTSSSNRESDHRLFVPTGETLSIKSQSLREIFSSNNVPMSFEFLSVDVEGGEMSVLQSNDWSTWRPKLITIEHNGRSDRNVMNQFLTGIGYSLSPLTPPGSWDDWYVLNSSIESSN